MLPLLAEILSNFDTSRYWKDPVPLLSPICPERTKLASGLSGRITSWRAAKRRHLATSLVTGNLHSLLIPCSIPVPIRRNRTFSCANTYVDRGLAQLGADRRCDIPCILPCYQGNSMEQGSRRTASTANQSPYFSLFPSFRQKLRFSGLFAWNSLHGHFICHVPVAKRGNLAAQFSQTNREAHFCRGISALNQATAQ